MNTTPSTPADLLAAFRSHRATSPRLSWYGPDSERVEFSGRVLENWVAKTANYLVDELDAEPGTVVAVDLPLHWRSLVWLLATWAVGATAVTGQATDGPDIVATANPAAALERLAGVAPAPLLVAVALPALQMRWLGELPPATLDYSGDVRAHADVFFADLTPAPSDVAWAHESLTVSYAGLLGQGGQGEIMIAGTAQQLPPEPQRVLLHVRDGWDAVVPAALTIWAAGGSIVLLDDGVAATDHLRSTENITLG